ncbi:MAG: 50S ribosomal protein L11 methyltransferase [Methanomicrobiales archaeon]|nr:50S ribosomal protein L11 methyltransferase [Methanomicrobiales archaeon]
MQPTAGSTADEVLAIALRRLAPRPGEVFADIGCGSGKVSIAASPLVREVYALDRRPEAVAWAREQARAAGVGNPAKAGRPTDAVDAQCAGDATFVGNPTGVGNIRFLEGEAPGALAGLPAPACAFIGGSANLAAVIGALAAMGTGRMVASCVRIETLAEAVLAMRELGIFREAILVQVARSKDLAGGTMFVPANPVYLVFGGAGLC